MSPLILALFCGLGVLMIFIGLASLDAVARTLGFILPSVDLNPAQPLSNVSSFMPRDLLILLPAVILLRLPRALHVTPFVFAGAVAISLGTLLAFPLGSLTLPVAMGVSAATFIPAIGWVAMGWGLTTLNPKTPPSSVAGTANLVATLVVLAAATLGVLPLVIPLEVRSR